MYAYACIHVYIANIFLTLIFDQREAPSMACSTNKAKKSSFAFTNLGCFLNFSSSFNYRTTMTGVSLWIHMHLQEIKNWPQQNLTTINGNNYSGAPKCDSGAPEIFFAGIRTATIMVSKKVLSVVLRFFYHIPTYILSKTYWKNVTY